MTLRDTFDSVADLYHRVRPRYPGELYDQIERSTGGLTGADVLEIGPATGIASVELARRGATLTGVELGAALAERALENLKAWPSSRIIGGSFEEASATGLLELDSYDLVVAATSWHWVEPERRYELAARHLRSGGSLAVWTAMHLFPSDVDPFFVDIQDVYDEIGESFPADTVLPGTAGSRDLTGEFEASGVFGTVEAHNFEWELSYSAAEYIELLSTFSDHIAMAPRKRQRLFNEIRSHLGARTDGLVRRHWGARLHIAQMLDR
ncbi:MAG: class I SAM-dependent methyltransferase [Actinobacteria bacterium]|nr:class I SAM-dependent methyltransferase [Actinomycetota bacterium]